MKFKTNKTSIEDPWKKIRNKKNKNQIKKTIYDKLKLNDKIKYK